MYTGMSKSSPSSLRICQYDEDEWIYNMLSPCCSGQLTEATNNVETSPLTGVLPLYNSVVFWNDTISVVINGESFMHKNFISFNLCDVAGRCRPVDCKQSGVYTEINRD